MQTNRPKCIIKDLTTADTVVVTIALIFTYAIAVLAFAGGLYNGFQLCFLFKDNITLLFMSKPIFSICLYISCYILYTLVSFLISFSAFVSSLKRTTNLLNGKLHKFIFVDDTNAILYTKYDTLDYLIQHGYEIFSKQDLEEYNKEE